MLLSGFGFEKNGITLVEEIMKSEENSESVTNNFIIGITILLTIFSAIGILVFGLCLYGVLEERKYLILFALELIPISIIIVAVTPGVDLLYLFGFTVIEGISWILLFMFRKELIEEENLEENPTCPYLDDYDQIWDEERSIKEKNII